MTTCIFLPACKNSKTTLAERVLDAMRQRSEATLATARPKPAPVQTTALVERPQSVVIVRTPIRAPMGTRYIGRGIGRRHPR